MATSPASVRALLQAELTRQMAGGDELTELSHELQG
jgi:hypothetical protein